MKAEDRKEALKVRSVFMTIKISCFSRTT